MESKSKRAPSTFYGIQALRGLAACMVVAHHATDLWSMSIPSLPGGWYTGQAGVDIFFVISGFVMAVSSMGRDEGPSFAWEFLKRRILRIVPLYWILTSLMLMKLVLVQAHPSFGHGSEHVLTTWQYVISSYLFVPYRNSIGIIAPVLEVGWTLSFEMLFYLLFTTALALKVGVLRFLTPVLLVLAAIGLFYNPNWPSFAILANPLLLEFLAGLWLGSAIQNGFQVRTSISAIVGIAGIVGFLIFPEPSNLQRFLMWGIPAFFIVASMATLESRFGPQVPKWAQLLGDASYSLYLSHMLSFAICYKLLTKLHLLASSTGGMRDEVYTTLICLGISIPFSLLLYSFIEKPMNTGLRRHFIKQRRPAS